MPGTDANDHTWNIEVSPRLKKGARAQEMCITSIEVSDYCSEQNMQSIKAHNNNIVFEKHGNNWLLSNFVQRKNDYIQVTLMRTCVPSGEMNGWIKV
jgi:hypothetical protein